MDAVRRASVSSNNELDKTTSNASAGSPPPSTVNPASGRRRVGSAQPTTYLLKLNKPKADLFFPHIL